MNINKLTSGSNIFDNINFTDTNKTNDKNITSFFDTLKEKLGEVNGMQINADNITEQFVSGEGSKDIHDVMIATEEAGMSMELAVQVRNKIVEAYQEISRMQL